MGPYAQIYAANKRKMRFPEDFISGNSLRCHGGGPKKV